MIIDWANFTLWSSLAGGLLIGVATAMFLLFNGRIVGISGVVGGYCALPRAMSCGASLLSLEP